MRQVETGSEAVADLITELAEEAGILDEEKQEIVEDEIPEPPAEPITKPGDLWILGEHRLLCGDSTKAEDVARLMDGAQADICFTSPPYNVAAKSSLPNKEKYQLQNDAKSEDDYCEFLELFCRLSIACCSYVFVNVQSVSGNKVSLIELLYRLKDAYADTVIWDKQGSEPAMACNVMNSRFEYVHVFSKKANRAIGTREFRGTVENVFSLNSRQGKDYSDIHKATFPVQLPAYFIGCFSNPSELIYEPFCGSGTTLIAAEQLGRKCYGMEISPQYCDVIVKRWETLTGKQATRG